MTHHFDVAIEAELQHRRATLQHAAAEHRLARRVGRAARSTAARATRSAQPARPAAGRPVPGSARA